MKRISLKIISIFLLISLLATPAFAVAPLILAAGEALAPFVVTAGITWLLPKTATTNVPKRGYADGSSIKRFGLAKVSGLFGVAVMGSIALAELRGLVGNPDSDSGKANPTLSSALYLGTGPQPFPTSPSSGVGAKHIKDGQNYVITGVESRSALRGVNESPPVDFSGLPYSVAYWGGAQNGYYTRFTRYTLSPIPFEPTIWNPNTDEGAVAKLNSPSLGELYPTAADELDKLIIAHPDLAKLPSTAARDIADAQRQIAANNVSDSLATKVDSLQSVKDTAQATYNANPTTENKTALDKAEADLAAAKAELAETEKEAAEDAVNDIDKNAEDAEIDAVDWTHPEPPEIKEIDFSPLLGIGAVVSGKFPFSLLQTVTAMVSSLVADPVAPTFTIHFPSPFNYDWVISLAPWDSWASLFRVLIGSAFLVAVSMSILRRWV